MTGQQKVQHLLGIKTVIAESFERIHRSNLALMGVLPLQFKKGENADVLGLTGKEVINVHIDENIKPRDIAKVTAIDEDGIKKNLKCLFALTLTLKLTTTVMVEFYQWYYVVNLLSKSLKSLMLLAV